MSYRTEVLADGPVAYYRLGDAGATVVAEVGSNGTYTGSPAHPTGALPGDADTAMTCDGVDDLATLPDLGFGEKSAATIECLVKFTAATAEMFVYSEGNAAASALIFGLIADAGGLGAYYRPTGAAVPDKAVAAGFNNGAWHHLVVTKNGLDLRVYVDGVFRTSIALQAGAQNVNLSNIGALVRASASNRFSGSVDEFAVYDSVLSDARIAAHFAAAGMSVQVAATTTFGSRERHARAGPFFYGGNVYVLAAPSTTAIRCYKAADPSSGFVAQNTAGEVAMVASLQNFAGVLHGSRIHIAAYCGGRIYYRVFDCATDTWVIAEQANSFTTAQACDIVVRSTGEPVIFYGSGSIGNMSYQRRTGVNTWTAAINTAAGFWGGAVLGAADRIHMFYTNGAGNAVHRVLDAANVVGAEQVLAAANTNRRVGRPARHEFADGTVRLLVAWAPTDATIPSVAVADSAAVPAWTITTTALDSVVAIGATVDGPALACATNGATEVVAYIPTGGASVKDAERPAAGAFGVDTTDEAVAATQISTAAYFNGTAWKLGLVYNAGGNVRYIERAIAGPPSGLDVPLGQAAETDTAQPLGETKAKALGPATSVETAMPITAHKAAPLGVATEADAALVIAVGRSVALGVAMEACEAFAIAPAKGKAIGLLAEENLARQIGASKARELGLVAEQDLATAVDSLKAAPLGLVSEVQVAFGLARLKAFALGLAGETDLAFSIVTIPLIPNRPVTGYAIGDSVASPETSTPSMTPAGFADRASDGGAILEDHP